MCAIRNYTNVDLKLFIIWNHYFYLQIEFI